MQKQDAGMQEAALAFGASQGASHGGPACHRGFK